MGGLGGRDRCCFNRRQGIVCGKKQSALIQCFLSPLKVAAKKQSEEKKTNRCSEKQRPEPPIQPL
jgi:hypothetical protein